MSIFSIDQFSRVVPACKKRRLPTPRAYLGALKLLGFLLMAPLHIIKEIFTKMLMSTCGHGEQREGSCTLGNQSNILCGCLDSVIL